MPSPLEVLQQYWGYSGFRAPQDRIIESVRAGRDTLALLPTGGGKSICFQVPGLMMPGLTLVISPLIALMKDQVERLNRLGIAATYIHSGLSKAEVDRKLEAATQGTYRFLYVAPERIDSEVFALRLPRMQVSLLAVDEAHCISQWGYDFRPAYLQIGQIREQLPDLPIIALTASATPAVKEDIIDKLGLRQPAVFTKSFRRDNLRYFILADENPAGRIVEIARRTRGSGIVYVRTRRLTERLARVLNEAGIPAGAYHGGMPTSERELAQQRWLDNEFRFMVATNAFGMGIDKPDVRLVLHYNLPADLESYYQEAGRGGRDGKTALAVAFKNAADLQALETWSRQKYPPWTQVRDHYEGLCRYYRVSTTGIPGETHPLRMVELTKALETKALPLYNSLRILHQEGLIFFSEEQDDYARVQVLAPPQSIWQYQQAHPFLAPLVEYLLRTLGGRVYQEEVRFQPARWTRSLGMEMPELQRQLQRLADQDLISYQPSLGEPVLRFLQPRHTLTRRELNWEKYEFLRAQQAKRLQALRDYVNQETVCRSLILQQYFGESAHEPCGRCDVCIGRYKTRVSDDEYGDIQAAILAALAKESLAYRELLTKVSVGSPAQREKVLRYLIDKQVVKVGAGGRLQAS
ncbi:MAG: RecQ family ATP-dependent DNA helicase [Bacteroidetes bacterium]|nr:MAG: RecQ family ATP-dependent DNA helicase [Bacteroidota bacterium]